MTNSTAFVKVLSGGLLATKSASIACALCVLREGINFYIFMTLTTLGRKETA